MIADDGLATSAMMKMAFVMNKYGELNDRKAVMRQTMDDYCDWLDQFTTGQLADALPAIQTFYLTSNGQSVDSKKKQRGTERSMTTALFLLRVIQIGLTQDDLDTLTTGTVFDIMTEHQNDDYNYRPVATQDDFDRF